MLAVMALSGESPRTAIYAFFFNYAARLGVLGWLQFQGKRGGGFWARFARAVTRPPHPQQPTACVVTRGDTDEPAGLGGYWIMAAGLGFMTFMIVNSAKTQFVTPGAVVVSEMRWALVLTPVWLLQDLWDRKLTLRFDQPLTTNLGYNSAETLIALVALLIGGPGSVFLGSAWPYFVALAGLMTLRDALGERRFPRGEHAPAASRQTPHSEVAP
jgi:hypothetical protein